MTRAQSRWDFSIANIAFSFYLYRNSHIRSFPFPNVDDKNKILRPNLIIVSRIRQKSPIIIASVTYLNCSS